MRYKETGNLHLEFHRSLNNTLRYLRTRYHQEFVDDLFRKMAKDVYRSIRQDLLNGDPSQLVEHWNYFFNREDGKIAIDREGEIIRMTVEQCPAVRTIIEHEELEPALCRGTRVLNDALVEGSQFAIGTEILGGGRCIQTIRRRNQ